MVKGTNLPVVVGVDGSEQCDRAVRFALAEARRRDVGMLLVHAVHETAPMAGKFPQLRVEYFTEVGRRLVDDAERLACDIDPAIKISKSVKVGSRVGTLVDAGTHASAIVLGHRSRSLPSRVRTSSTTTGVAARAHCPVISVPESWVEGSDEGRIVVGVDGSDAAHDALDLGFREARRRGAYLVALHAWRLPIVYEGVGYPTDMVDDWMTPAAEEMEKTLSPLRETYPDVKIDVDLRHEFAGPALLEATEHADLIVVGRRGHGAPWGIYLGSLARWLACSSARACAPSRSPPSTGAMSRKWRSVCSDRRKSSLRRCESRRPTSWPPACAPLLVTFGDNGFDRGQGGVDTKASAARPVLVHRPPANDNRSSSSTRGPLPLVSFPMDTLEANVVVVQRPAAQGSRWPTPRGDVDLAAGRPPFGLA